MGNLNNCYFCKRISANLDADGRPKISCGFLNKNIGRDGTNAWNCSEYRDREAQNE
jgi:hypothetical protein